MKISLIELSVNDTSAIGVRSLSAFLKRAGYQVQLIFLANAGKQDESGVFLYPQRVIEETVNLCRDSQLIGLSFLTSGFHRAVQLTERLKYVLDIPVIWGDIHATVEPEQCLNYADGVCRGEGEEALLELVQKMAAGQDFYDTRNFWFKKNGETIKNPVRPLIQDLDSLPFLDYDLAGEHFAYVEKKEALCRLDKALLLEFITPKRGRTRRTELAGKPVYSTMASRGCPNTCDFCLHSTYKPLYHRQRYLRRRSPANIIQELANIISAYDFHGVIWFSDDDFLAATTNEIKEFSELYKEKIRMPFFCLGSPNSIREKKLEYLTDSYLRYFELGIQTGSTKTKKKFNRSDSTEKILSTCKLINKFHHKIPVTYYDFILDNPWETVQDEIETLDLILQLPRPYELALASFRYFPGSVIYEDAKRQGLINLETRQIYSGELLKLKGSYINLLIVLYAFYKVPRGLIKILAHPSLVRLLNRKGLANLYKLPYKIQDKIHKAVTFVFG
jgi:anaerobic magnesium-protoporphyrin IX monomethyl ester cyclase